MSSYSKLPRRSKVVGVQHGLKRIAVRDRASVGCPKILEVWLPETEWIRNAHECVEKIYTACQITHAANRDTLYIET